MRQIFGAIGQYEKAMIVATLPLGGGGCPVQHGNSWLLWLGPEQHWAEYSRDPQNLTDMLHTEHS